MHDDIKLIQIEENLKKIRKFEENYKNIKRQNENGLDCRAVFVVILWRFIESQVVVCCFNIIYWIISETHPSISNVLLSSGAKHPVARSLMGTLGKCPLKFLRLWYPELKFKYPMKRY